jgi:pimeloyl-ACP methyl ester carboxylesterase
VAASRIDCGFLDVPENRSRPAGLRVRIPVVRIRSIDARASADPVVFLHGGPGAAPLGSARTVERFSQHPFAAHRDIILFNQRGSAQTDPVLKCEALRAGRNDIYAADLTLAQRDTQIAGAAAACLREMKAKGVDLEVYGAAAAAEDLRDLREALSIERWNLLAVSYGTLIALEAARIDPRGIRSLILDSIVSPQSDLFMSEGPRNFSIGLDRLLDACAQEPACVADFPDLARQLQEVLDALEKKPIVVTVAGEGGRGTVDIAVNWHDFLNAIHWMLYNAQSLRQVPLLIHTTRIGDLRLLTQVMDRIFPAPRNGPSGASPAFFAFVCRDQFTRDRVASLAPANPVYRGFSIVSFIDEACADTVDRPRIRFDALESPLPALLLSGRFDPMTPDLYARQVAAMLSQANFVAVGNSGHSTLSDFDACQTRLAVEFVETLRMPTSCAPQEMRPVFIRSLEELQ